MSNADGSEACAPAAESDAPKEKVKKPKKCLNPYCPVSGTPTKFFRADDLDKRFLGIDPEGNKRKFLCDACFKTAREKFEPYKEKVFSRKITLEDIPKFDAFVDIDVVDEMSSEESDPECDPPELAVYRSCSPNFIQQCLEEVHEKYNIEEILESDCQRFFADRQREIDHNFVTIDQIMKSDQRLIDTNRRSLYVDFDYPTEVVAPVDADKGPPVGILYPRPYDGSDSDEVLVIDDTRLDKPSKFDFIFLTCFARP